MYHIYLICTDCLCDKCKLLLRHNILPSYADAACSPRRLSVHNCRNVLKSPYMSPYPSFLHKNPSFFTKLRKICFPLLWSNSYHCSLLFSLPAATTFSYGTFGSKKCLPINSNLQILLLFYQLSTYTRSSATSIILVNVFSRSSAVVASPVTAESDTVRIQIAFAPA